MGGENSGSVFAGENKQASCFLSVLQRDGGCSETRDQRHQAAQVQQDQCVIPRGALKNSQCLLENVDKALFLESFLLL